MPLLKDAEAAVYLTESIHDLATAVAACDLIGGAVACVSLLGWARNAFTLI